MSRIASCVPGSTWDSVSASRDCNIWTHHSRYKLRGNPWESPLPTPHKHSQNELHLVLVSDVARIDPNHFLQHLRGHCVTLQEVWHKWPSHSHDSTVAIISVMPLLGQVCWRGESLTASHATMMRQWQSKTFPLNSQARKGYWAWEGCCLHKQWLTLLCYVIVIPRRAWFIVDTCLRPKGAAWGQGRGYRR